MYRSVGGEKKKGHEDARMRKRNCDSKMVLIAFGCPVLDTWTAKKIQ